MFQRIRGAIDRTIAEEQARQQRSASPGSVSRSGSVVRSSADGPPRRRPNNSSSSNKKLSQDGNAIDGASPGPTSDPDVFEAAFVIDDSDTPSRSSTPANTTSNATTTTTTTAMPGADTDRDAAAAAEGVPEARKDSAESNANTATNEPRTDPPAKHELPPEIRARLRKLDKLEATYPELLRSYRVAHGRATSIEPFERALRENTPLTSIREPTAFVEYLNQLALKSDMVLEELKRVTGEKDAVKRRLEAAEQQLAEVGTQREEKKSEEFFSIDTELPRLQAEAAEKAAEIERLQGDIEQLTEDLSAAKASNAELTERLQQTATAPADPKVPVLEAKLGAAEAKLVATETKLAATEAELQAKAAEAATLTTRLADSETKITELETKSTAATATLTKELDAEKQRAQAAETKTTELQRKTESHTALIAKLQQTIAATAKKDSLSIPTTAPKAPVASPEPSPTQSTGGGGGGGGGASRKKNKKKKKGGAGGGPAQQAQAQALATVAAEADADAEPAPSETSEHTLVGGGGGGIMSDVGEQLLQAEIVRLQAEIDVKDAQIERLSRQRKTEESLREEIGMLQDEILSIGHDHVTDKETIKNLEADKARLVAQIAGLETQIATTSTTASAQTAQLQADLAALQTEHAEATARVALLTSDLGAAQLLAQTRYKDASDLREILQKAQPELKSLRAEAATLKTTKEELAARVAELRAVEKREREATAETTRAQRLMADREGEVKSLREKLTAETNQKLRLEDEKRVAGRDLRRAEAELVTVSAKEEKATRELQRVQEELARMQPRLKTLDDEVAKLRRDQATLRDEASLKASQYANAQKLLASMRDQTAELSVQLKEAQTQSEALDEELAECRKLLAERTREGETMRRLLADVDDRADSKVRDMRARMDEALAERDRIEDEASTLARRRAREAEDVRAKMRDLERQVTLLTNERDDAEQREKEWRRHRDELQQVETKAEAEVDEMRATVASLRVTLDASERQVRDIEKQKADLRRVLDEQRQRYEKALRDAHKAASVNRLNSTSGGRSASPSPSPAASGGGSATRNSMESVRSAGGSSSSATANNSAPDAVYLKTILLQFLEQKDNKLRAQLVPVLGKLLQFNRADEQKWLAAVQHLNAR